MRKSSSTTSRVIRGSLAAGTALAAVLAGTASPAFAEPKLTLSASSGPSAGGNTITAQAPTTGAAPFLASTPPVVQFQAITSTVTACTATYKTPAAVAGTGTGASATLTAGAVDASTVTRINSYRIAVRVPAGVVLPNNFTSARFNMCVYDSTSTTTSTLLASAAYSIAAKPIITNITPTAGPALGGYQISVSGTGFTAGSTATLGNVPLTGVTVNSTGTLLTGTAPARTAGSNIQLVVTTAGGTVTSNDPNNDTTTTDATNFTLSNGIVATPNTAPTGTTPDLDIFGVGFSQMTFADTTASNDPTAATPHIVLVSRSAGYQAAASGTGRPITTCVDALVLSDTELICRLLLDGSFDVTAADTSIDTAADVPTGVYNLQIIRTGAAAATLADIDATVITSGSTFTVAPY